MKKDLTSKRTKLCIGSMDKRITIQKRVQKFQSGGMTFAFEDVLTVWAGLETKSGLTKFNDINIEKIPTHIWKVRKIAYLTSEYWINYGGYNYEIIAVENVNGRSHQYIYTRLSGSDTKDGSES